MTTEYIEACPECNGKQLIVDTRRGELYCQNCNMVLADRIVHQETTPIPEVQAEPGDARMLPQHFYAGRDQDGRPVPADTLWKLRRTSKVFNLKPPERAVLLFESRLKHLALQRGLSETVTRRAIDMYHHIREKHVFNKPNLTELALGLLLSACREMKVVITLEDLIAHTQFSLNKVKRYHYEICRGLHVRYVLPSVNNFIFYFAGKVNVLNRGQMLEEAVRIATANSRPNAAPHCVAAAALYIVLRNTGSNISQKDYCSVVNLSEISLREWVVRLGGYGPSYFIAPPVSPKDLHDGP